jgi:hypothetical protein
VGRGECECRGRPGQPAASPPAATCKPTPCERNNCNPTNRNQPNPNPDPPGLIEENPELLIRMTYYLSEDVRLLDDLPVEIQTMFIPPGDMGIGWLYRHYRNSKKT